MIPVPQLPSIPALADYVKARDALFEILSRFSARGVQDDLEITVAAPLLVTGEGVTEKISTPASGSVTLKNDVAISLPIPSANQFLAGPVSGSPAAATFREIDESDILALDIPLSVVVLPYPNATPPVDTLNAEDWWRHSWSTGITDPDFSTLGITLNGAAGTVDIAATDFVTREGTAEDATLEVMRAAGTTGLACTANDVSYVFRNWNSGTPVWQTGVNISDFNGTDKVIGWAVARNGTRMNVLSAQGMNVDFQRKVRRKNLEFTGYKYGPFWQSILGPSTVTASGLNVLVGVGKYFWFENPHTHAAFDTSVAGAADANNFIYFYNRTPPWTQIAGQKSIDATQYDNAGVLTAMTANKWRTDWLYAVLDAAGSPYLAVVMGNAQYNTQALAQAAPQPTLPHQIDGVAVLLAQLTIKKSAATFTVSQASGTAFAGTGSTAASSLEDATGVVDVAASAAPGGAGYFLISTSATAATWQQLSNKFIVQGTADSMLTGAQFLGALDTGYVKNTTTTGVLTVQATPIPIADGGTGAATAAANLFFAGPTTGADAAPSFRAIDTADLGAFLGVAVQIPGVFVLPDSNISLGSAYERVTDPMGMGPGFIQLAPHRTFDVTHANAIATTTTVEGWTSRNTTNYTSADTNSSLAGSLHLVHDNSHTDDQFNTTDTASNWMRARDALFVGAQEVVARLKVGYTQAGQATAIEIRDSTDRTKYWARAEIKSGTPSIAFTYNINGTSTTPTTVALTAQQINTDGVWIKLTRVGSDVAAFYSTAVQTTPPTGSWTRLDQKSAVFKAGTMSFECVIAFYRYNVSATTNLTADIMYFDEEFITTPFEKGVGIGAIGYDDSGPVLTLVSGAAGSSGDLGSANATLSNVAIGNALTDAINIRGFDNAAWTFSAVRGSSPSPAAGAYQTIGSLAVGGSGRYFALYAKATSTGRTQPASIDTSAIRIPIGGVVSQTFTPAITTFTTGSVLFGGASGSIDQDNSNLFWDDTNNYLGIGNNTPAHPLDVYRSTGGTVVNIGASGDVPISLTMINGSNTSWMGIEKSVAGTTFTSSLAYASLFGTQSAKAVQIVTNSTARITTDSAGLVGIATNAPAYGLDINAAFGSRASAVTLSNGANQNIAAPTTSLVVIGGPTADFSIGGIQGGHDGQIVTYINNVGFKMTANYNDGGSTAANRIAHASGANVAITGPGGTWTTYAFMTLQYVAGSINRWMLCEHS